MHLKSPASFAILAILTVCAVALLAWLLTPPSNLEVSPGLAAFAPEIPSSSAAPTRAALAEHPLPLVSLHPTPDVAAAKQLATALTRRILAWEDNDDPAFREFRMREMQTMLAGSDLFAVVQELPSNLTGYAFALPSVRQKLLADPDATLAWMEGHSNIAAPQLVTFLHDWDTANPQQMQQAIASITAGPWRETVLEAAANNFLSSDPITAINLAAQLRPGPAQSRLLTMAVTTWSAADPDAAYQWSSQIPDPFLRDQLNAVISRPSALPVKSDKDD